MGLISAGRRLGHSATPSKRRVAHGSKSDRIGRIRWTRSTEPVWRDEASRKTTLGISKGRAATLSFDLWLSFFFLSFFLSFLSRRQPRNSPSCQQWCEATCSLRLVRRVVLITDYVISIWAVALHFPQVCNSLATTRCIIAKEMYKGKIESVDSADLEFQFFFLHCILLITKVKLFQGTIGPNLIALLKNGRKVSQSAC